MATHHEVATAFGLPVNGQGGSGQKLIVGPGAGQYGTIQEAVNAAQEGETIFVMPGEYDENITVTTDYVTIIGAQLGGYGRPDVTATAGVALTVTAQGFVCKRMRFFSGDGSDCVVQEGNGFKYEDCVFDDATTAAEAGLRLKGNADDDSFTASEGVVDNCLFRGCAVGLIFDTGDAPGNGVGCTHDVIKDCRFIDCTQDINTKDTGGGVYSVQDTLITGCQFLDKNKTVYIDLTTANGGAAGDQTGMISNCYFGTDSITTTNVAMVGTGFVFVGNYDSVGVQDGSGLD